MDGEELHCDSTGTFTKEKRLDLSCVDLIPLLVFFEYFSCACIPRVVLQRQFPFRLGPLARR
jgi:hypothetical protein